MKRKKILKLSVFVGVLATLSVGVPVQAFEDQYNHRQDYLPAIGYSQKVRNISTGKGIVVAVIDDGVWQQHPDLKGSEWVNSGEIPQNGKDDDGNGYVDDYYGWNFVSNNSDVSPNGSHATLAAGVIAAQHNSIGITGIAPDVKIMNLVACESSCSRPATLQAMIYAIKNGADVLSISLGGTGYLGYDSAFDATVLMAQKYNVQIVTSAGNGDPYGSASGSNLNFLKSSPVSNDVEGYNLVFGVGASNVYNTEKTTWTNYGDAVDIHAPGEEIYSTSVPKFSGVEYEQVNGTSFSAPMVAGALALVKAKYPQFKTVDYENLLKAAPYLNIDKMFTNYAYSTSCVVLGFNVSTNSDDSLVLKGRGLPSKPKLYFTKPNTNVQVAVKDGSVKDSEHLVIDLSLLEFPGDGVYTLKSDACRTDWNQLELKVLGGSAQPAKTVSLDPVQGQPVENSVQPEPAPVQKKAAEKTVEQLKNSIKTVETTLASESGSEQSDMEAATSTATTTNNEIASNEVLGVEIDELVLQKLESLYGEVNVLGAKELDGQLYVAVRHKRRVLGIFPVTVTPVVRINQENLFERPSWQTRRILRWISW